jgi:uncharacterized membrane protein YoaK (UPF0700 family)
MKITLKNVVLVLLIVFYLVIILSNFSSTEGFEASTDTSLTNNIVEHSSTVAPTASKKSTTSTLSK